MFHRTSEINHPLGFRSSKKLEQSPMMPQVSAKKEKEGREDIIRLEGKKKEKYVWEGKGTSKKVLESLKWMIDYREPLDERDQEKSKKKEEEDDDDETNKGKKMGDKQIEKSYENFDKWFDQVIKDETKKARDLQDKLLEG